MRKPESPLDEIYIITVPCETMQKAEEEFERARNNIPKDIYSDYFLGNQNGIVETSEKITFQKGKWGIRVELAG